MSPNYFSDLNEQQRAAVMHKGGAPGQWSGRKAQMLASEYKKRVCFYTS